MLRILKYLFVYALYLTGGTKYAKRRARQRGAIAILTFHRVLPDKEFTATSSLPGTVIRESSFAALTDYIREHCTPVDLCGGNPRTDTNPSPQVAITFDDGWADNAIIASTLNDKALPALVFICPGIMGKPFPFWPEKAIAAKRLQNHVSWTELETFVEELKSKPPQERNVILSSMPMPDEQELRASEPLNATLSWNHLLHIMSLGWSCGSHTYSHQILTQIPASEAGWELSESRLEIERRIGKACETLAYPNGNVSSAIRRQAQQAGYKLAFTTRLGLWTKDCDPLLIPRINISENHVRGPLGKFSRAMFEYHVFWRAGRDVQSPFC